MKHIYEVSLDHFTTQGYSFSEVIDTLELDGDLTVQDYFNSLDDPDGLCPTAEEWGWLVISEYDPEEDTYLKLDEKIIFDTTM